jgi:ubiquinone biosynthesis protein
MGLKQDIKDLKRFKQVISVFLKYDLGFLVKKIKLHRDLPLKKRLNKKTFEPKRFKPSKLRKAFEELGGGFIKIAQILSLRPDLIPPDYAKEFSKLQDHVPEFPTEKAVKIVEEETNQPIEKIFKSFSKKPIASASIGQAHIGILTSGRKVLVKVKRPDIDEKIQQDLDIVKYIMGLFEKNHKLEFFDIKGIIQEVERFTKDELNFKKEASNINLFYKYNIDEKNIIAPKVHHNLTTRNLLVMDFIEGKTLNNIEPPKKAIAKKIINSIFKQVFIDGFFHGDPHPGNIIVKGRKIAFVDFGIMGQINKELKDKIFDIFVSAIRKDPDKMSEALLDLNIHEGVPKEKVIEDLKLNFKEYYGKKSEKIDFKKVYKKIFDFAREDDIILPLDFVLFGKSIITAESVVTKYDPSFNLIKEAKPFIKKTLKEELSIVDKVEDIGKSINKFKDFFKKIPKNTRKFIEELSNTDKNLQKIDEDVKTLTVEIDRSSNRVTYSVILASLIVSSALLINEKTYTIAGISAFSFIGFSIAAIICVIILISVIKEKKIKKGDKK